jgi:hypothetical protein
MGFNSGFKGLNWQAKYWKLQSALEDAQTCEMGSRVYEFWVK